MSKYILRWQYGIFNDEVKLHYTYGHINTLREKAKVLATNEKITYIKIDKVEEVIKDTREDTFLKCMRNGK